MSEPGWVAHAILWQVYPLGFTGAPVSVEAQDAVPSHGADGTHSLDRLVGWLDYAVELGMSGILLGPIFASETHGYDTVDYFRLDPRLAGPSGEDSFDVLIREAHHRGLRVVLDGVFNHVGRSFEPFRRALAEGPAAPEFGWFRAIGDPSHQRFENFEGHDALVLLNHDEPAVVDLVAEVMTHWLGRGADGWRLDAAYAVPPAFWASVLPRVRSEHPEAFVFGEVIHGDYPGIVRESTFDSLTQYELWKAIWSAVSDANFWELSAALERHNGFLQSFVPVTFVGNHDVNRLATSIADERHRAHALVVLMTAGGTPTVYYGDEQGLAAAKEEREGGDDAIRPEFDAAGPDALPPGGWPVYHLHQNLIGLRRRNPWLHTARTTNITLTNEFFAYEVSAATGAADEGAGAQRLIVMLNLADSDYTQTLPGACSVVAGSAAWAVVAGTSTVVTVPPHGWVVIQPG
ncbi:alpha-amylase [Subtercola boreus]|uniref:Alpha-amylase n=1 Tax=Subtercola boreus TaxID=120213 RepID=A0A3E0VL41_9MICO|nr:alpha-amylase family protein [Subtercola boreus]RFA10140.1 alpha-amylase [Subtercola boreus]TQL52701.1 cyclomaltodextrinase [Subtercola boreus]